MARRYPVVFLGVTALLLLCMLPAAAVQVRMTQLDVQFTGDRQVRVSGQVVPNGLSSPGAEIISNYLSVTVETVIADGAFPVLPEWFAPPGSYGKGNAPLTLAELRGSRARSYIVVEQELSNDATDNGRVVAFDSTIDLQQNDNPGQYRVTATLKHDYRRRQTSAEERAGVPVYGRIVHDSRGPAAWATQLPAQLQLPGGMMTPDSPSTPQDLLLKPQHAPQGWVVAQSLLVPPMDVVAVLSDVAETQSVQSRAAAIQTIQTGDISVAVIALKMDNPQAVSALIALLARAEGASTNTVGLVTLPGTPLRHCLQSGSHLYIIVGGGAPVSQLVNMLP